MKSKKLFNKGFTLLELLVVVLIIGILAGIALPQYKRAKEKAEASQLLVSIKAFHSAQQRYYLANGDFADNLDTLDTDFGNFQRGGCEDFSMFPKYDCLSNDKNVIFLAKVGRNERNTLALRKTGKYKRSGFMIPEKNVSHLNLKENKIFCYEYGQSGFCSELFNCTLYSEDGTNYMYSCSF